RNEIAPGLQPRSILEFGCGPGRLAIPFSRRAQTTAVDIDPAMLDHARRNAERFGAPGIRFQTLDEFRGGSEKFELVNALLVLQRMPVDEGLETLRMLLSRIAGVGVFQLPVKQSVSALRRVAKAVRRKPPHIYSLPDVLAIIGECTVVPAKWGDLDVVTIYVYRPSSVGTGALAEPPELPPDLIDVRKMIDESTIDRLNETAEGYFSSLTSWDGHLAKPFNNAEDAPAIMINLATILQGLRLYPGARVLEFGGGTGWLSRWLAQLGCRVTMLDVSATALRIAQELLTRNPLIGDKPAPQFLQFDGRHIDLPDASVDRIVCFDAFHHAPNPGEVLQELARVLAPGGIAAFAEPGPEHSRTAQSQYEMRTYGVVENDIHIHALWSAARAAGFTDIRVAAFNARPMHLHLDQYDDLLGGGATLRDWAQWTREFMQNVRDFFLYKGSPDALDSRHVEGLSCVVEVLSHEGMHLRVRVTNNGRAAWLPSTGEVGAVFLGGHLYDGEGKLLQNDYMWQELPRALAPGQSVELEFDLPALSPGEYEVELDCVAREIAWFSRLKSKPIRLALLVSS
ncbi:MAG TPA: methyltransferase domain-containing protein, partial [Thermoanaerobaculia bacterium]